MSTLTITVLSVLLTFAAVIAIGFAVTRRTAQAQRSVALAQSPPIATAAPVYVPSPAAAGPSFEHATMPEAPRAEAITWPSLIDESISDLPLEERRALIARLVVVNDEWTLPILRRAVHEERDPQLLDAVVDALIAKRPA
jgi:hypothetical protein